VFDLFEYVQPKVTAEQRDQRPYFKGELGSNFPIALFRGGRKGNVVRAEDGFRYDAYISYVDRPPDGDWVWDTLVPRLQRAGVRVAVADDVLEPGVERVVGVERAISMSRRTVVVLSEEFLKDRIGHFESVLAQSMGVNERSYRLIPVYPGPVAEDLLPPRLRQLVSINLAHPTRAQMQWTRLIDTLKGPLPKWEG
jgi:hypothetical protein